MKPIFIDTSALIAIGNKRDTFHSQTIIIKDELRQSNRNFVTTNAILLEFGNAFSAANLKPSAIRMIESIRQSSKWKKVFTADHHFEQAGFNILLKIRF